MRDGAGVAEWFELLKHSKPAISVAMQIDYDVYAEGEALLGWLNATVRVDSQTAIDSSEMLQSLASEMQTRWVKRKLRI